MDKHLHIVSFDVPFPAGYGGVIDVFYKIVWLHRQAVKIHLHCFTKGNATQPELEKYCESVYYYKRQTGWKGISPTMPYIVSSRKNKELLSNLKKDNHPILFEGIHTTYWLYKEELASRQIFIRLHNVEYKYYAQLQRSERGFFKRLYFKLESHALKKYEAIIARKAYFLPMSDEDANVYRNKFNAQKISVIAVFTPWNEVISIPANSGFCLYHGNLSVSENAMAVRWLTTEIFNKVDAPLIVAGRSPSKLLSFAVAKLPNARLHADPTDEAMKEHLQHAFINVLPSFNTTGIKLKLLNAMYNSHHCLVNSWAVAGSGLEELCVIADDDETFIAQLKILLGKSFTAGDIAKRKAVLYEKYSNEKNSKFLSSLLH